MLDLPPQTAEAVAAVEQVLATLFDQASLWRDSATVGRALEPTASDPKSVASKARREGQIFAAWDGQHYRYPSFQFDDTGKPHPMTASLVAALPRGANGKVGRDAVLWVFCPDAAFGGQTPANAFSDEPRRVVSVASSRLSGGLDA